MGLKYSIKRRKYSIIGTMINDQFTLAMQVVQVVWIDFIFDPFSRNQPKVRKTTRQL